MMSDLFQEDVKIEGGMFTNIRNMLPQEGFRAATALDLQHG